MSRFTPELKLCVLQCIANAVRSTDGEAYLEAIRSGQEFTAEDLYNSLVIEMQNASCVPLEESPKMKLVFSTSRLSSHDGADVEASYIGDDYEVQDPMVLNLLYCSADCFLTMYALDRVHCWELDLTYTARAKGAPHFETAVTTFTVVPLT